MNKDQVKGAAKDVAGRIQEEAGKLTWNKEQQAKGLAKQVSGKSKRISVMPEKPPRMQSISFDIPQK